MEYLEQSHKFVHPPQKFAMWVIDDDRDLCDAYVDYLSAYFDVSASFQDPLAALSSLQACTSEQIPQVMVIDRLMPKLDGLMLSREIQKLRLPIGLVMVTGSDEGIDRGEANDLNIFGVVRKPCSIHTLTDLINRYREFNLLCERIIGEVLRLARTVKEQCEFFVGEHFELRKANEVSVRRKQCLHESLLRFIEHFEIAQIRLPKDSELPLMIREFEQYSHLN